MSDEVKSRHIRVIKDLPISQLTDEEIVKATINRLKTDCVMLVYNGDDNKLMFIGRHKKTGLDTMRKLKHVCEMVFGKMKLIKEDD